MYAHWSDIRQNTLDLRATDAQGESQQERLRRTFYLAYNRLAGDVPKALFIDREPHIVLGATTPTMTIMAGSTQRYIKRTTDPWVLEFVDSTGAPYPTGGIPTDAWSPMLDHSWDGSMWLELVSTNGKTHRRQSREWWIEDDQVFTHVYVSLDQPYTEDDLTTYISDWRIVEPEIFLPQECFRVYFPARLWTPERNIIGALQEQNAGTLGMNDYRGWTTGPPTAMFRARTFQVPTPNRPPTTETVDNVNWVGPQPKGQFRFVYTRALGKRPPERGVAPGGIRDPLWESAPSPVSEAFNHGAGNSVIQINVPDIDFMQNFGSPTSLRYNRSGYYTRIYVERETIIGTAPPAGMNVNIEYDKVYYLLAEVYGPDIYYRWDGSVNPDYFRRLRHSTGYTGFALYPYPDKEYTIDFDVSRLPDAIWNDADTPFLRLDAIPTLTEVFLHYFARMDGSDMAGAQQYLANYLSMVNDLRDRYQNAAGVINSIAFPSYENPALALQAALTMR